MDNLNDERRKLLMVRQGLAEDIEPLPDREQRTYRELNNFEKVENFFYYYKWIIISVIVVVALIGFLVLQTISRENEDLNMMVIATRQDSELYSHAEQLKAALEKYCPDFNEDGKIIIRAAYIDLTAGEETGEYYISQTQKFSNEIHDGTGQMIITDEGFAELVYGKDGFNRDDFLDLTEIYPEKSLYENSGMRVSDTELASSADWNDCPESVFILIRAQKDDDSKKAEKRDEQRQRAQTVLQNIIDGNVVNG
ncbi:MAG: hypothetical protein J1F09_01060 [Oscillospiraceae bacterium]|nr:hypothetical protein [Oscillospiraceae bacterium]